MTGLTRAGAHPRVRLPGILRIPVYHLHLLFWVIEVQDNQYRVWQAAWQIRVVCDLWPECGGDQVPPHHPAPHSAHQDRRHHWGGQGVPLDHHHCPHILLHFFIKDFKTYMSGLVNLSLNVFFLNTILIKSSATLLFKKLHGRGVCPQLVTKC